MSAAAAASSSNTTTLVWPKYDVFLSFRGEDTRDNFVSHLHATLDQKKIKTYKDDENIERGQEISEAIKQAIQESKLSVVIFSENYASSTWCLDELVHILRCKEINGRIILPVFYHVDPSHVRRQQGDFGNAFSEVEKRFNGKIEMVNEWRIALTTVANLSGWSSSVIRSEAKLVEQIASDVIKILEGMLQPSDDFLGLDGIAPLANVVSNQFSSQFEACCFLASIREEWNNDQNIYLQNKFLSELLEEENPYNVMALQKYGLSQRIVA